MAVYIFLRGENGRIPAMTASRADVPEKYKWDTTDLYPSDEAWKRAAADIEARIPALAEFQKTLGRSA